MIPKIDYTNCPPNLIGGLQRYLEHRIEPGSFLRAVLENDLKGAIGRFSMSDHLELFRVVKFLYNEFPGALWGSEEKVARWLAGDCRHGLPKTDRCFDCDGNTGIENR